MHFENEKGVDEGALTQDFFDNLFSTLSHLITAGTDLNGVVLFNDEEDGVIQKGVAALMVWFLFRAHDRYLNNMCTHV